MTGKNKSAIKYWPENERPRERLIRYGSNSLSDAHLLGILIGSGDRRSKKNAVDLSRDLLKVFGSLENIDQATVNEICQVKGIGSAKAAQIKAALEVGKRMSSKSVSLKTELKSSQALVTQFAPFMRNLKKEIVKIVLLDNKLQLIKDLTVSEGSLNASIVHPREVMIPAIRESAASFALLHNHPSGDPSPSQKDFEITHRLNQTGKIVGIHMIDHIIIAGSGFFSFADEGLL
ncbi:MAG: JAB domain-containing protein [Nitrospinae bacterium]|nr:JAB domain-containing protein [Nitrospinota bacterium]